MDEHSKIPIPLWLLSAVGSVGLMIASTIVSSVTTEQAEHGAKIEALSSSYTSLDVRTKHMEDFAQRTDGKIDRILELLRQP